MNILHYRQSAASWNEALPLGNGRLGAMVFGGVTLERLQLNEDSVWSGGFTDRVNPDARRYLPQIRQLLSEGRIADLTVAEPDLEEIFLHYYTEGGDGQ